MWSTNQTTKLLHLRGHITLVFWFSDRQERRSGGDRHVYLINETADQPLSENSTAKRNDPGMPVLSGRIITPSSSDPIALVAVYNGESISWLWKLHFFLFCFDFVTWFCHNLNRHASLLRNVLTENQTASFYFQVGIYSAVLRGSQWGGGFYGYRLKFWLFYGYRLIFFSYG